jgi:signal peptide peptidase SppA
MDSPGGQAAGVFDLAAKIRAVAKPTMAHVNEMALSAGYVLAAATQKIVMAKTAMVGSVGVIALHVDRSKKNAKDGYAYTAIHAGAKKADGSPHAPLSDSARADMQASVDSLYSQFVEYVAETRGLDAAAVRAQEAGVYSGQAALDAGLADGISSFNDALAAFEADVSKGASFSTGGFRQLQSGGKTMSENTHLAATETPTAEQLAAQLAAANADGAKAMQARIQAIQTCDEAKGREKLAAHLAFNTAMSADEAKGLLAVSAVEPLAVSANPQNALAAGMAKVTNPEVGTEGESTSDPLAASAALWGRSNAKLRAVK